jgi:hypothetical protein
MTPQPDKEQAVREIYLLLRRAAAGRQPVAAVYDGLPRLLCPMCWAGKQAGSTRSSISLEEVATAAYQWRQMEWAPGAASPWRNSAMRADAWHTQPRAPRQTWMDEIDFDADAQSGDNPQ